MKVAITAGEHIVINTEDKEVLSFMTPLLPTIQEHVFRVDTKIGARRAAILVSDELKRRGSKVKITEDGNVFTVEETE